VAPEIIKTLLWRDIIKAGYPVEKTNLDFWELRFLGMIEEIENDRI
jgi:hypothetical protein